jgi:EthD domain
LFKLILTIKKKRGTSLEQFMNYYDQKHVPLLKNIMPPLELHRRNYILTDHPFYSYVGDDRKNIEPPFDVITEVFYATESEARATMKVIYNDAAGRELIEDEKEFIEPHGINFYVVKVHQSAIPW